ncbi:MAG: hypothetical protein LBU51_04790 [Bacteroidales bacterium]|jgi:hypothetical protein|nr:hypothetical protein [Bacteroidales bacterium]
MLKNLDELKSNIQFEMPENDYFEAMKKDLFKKIHQKKKNLRLRTIIYSTSIAASFLIIFTVIQYFPSTTDPGLAQLTEKNIPIDQIAIDAPSVVDVAIEPIANASETLAVVKTKAIATPNAFQSTVAVTTPDDEVSFQVAAYYEEELADLSNFDIFCY